jgi:hypothetical protein
MFLAITACHQYVRKKFKVMENTPAYFDALAMVIKSFNALNAYF